MSLKISPLKAKGKIEEFLREIDDLLKVPYSTGEEKNHDLDIRIRNFVSFAFIDTKEKLHSYTGILLAIGGIEDSSEEKQKDYEESLKKKRRHLMAWKEEVELNENISESNSTLNKINTEINEANLESTRREEVAKSKFFGAVIELLDFQRNLIKEKEQTTKAIIEIQKDMADVKDALIKNRKE